MATAESSMAVFADQHLTIGNRLPKSTGNKICAEILRLPLDRESQIEVNNILQSFSGRPDARLTSKHLVLIALDKFYINKGQPQELCYLGALLGMEKKHVKRAFHNRHLQVSGNDIGYVNPVNMVYGLAIHCGYPADISSSMTHYSTMLIQRKSPTFGRRTPQLIGIALIGHYLKISGYPVDCQMLASRVGIHASSIEETMSILQKCDC